LEQENIIRKIQKLLALSKSSNEAEASLAASRAQELLAQHNLDYAMIQDAVVAGGTNQPAPEKRDKVRMKRSAMYKWQRELWEAIAEANFCWWSLITCSEPSQYRKDKYTGEPIMKHVRRHLILGRESNVIAVQMLGEYLCDTIERLVPYPQQQFLSRDAVNWRAGCADTLMQRIREDAESRKKKQEHQAKASDGALILLRDVYQHEYEANWDFKYGEGSYRRKQLMDAEWEAGQAERDRRAAEQEEKEEREWLEYLKNETPEQKKAREKQEAKERLKDSRRRSRGYSWTEQDRREAARVDSSAYHSGKQAGKSISLSQQVKDNSRRRLE